VIDFGDGHLLTDRDQIGVLVFYPDVRIQEP
jgi:hypothetical protein